MDQIHLVLSSGTNTGDIGVAVSSNFPVQVYPSRLQNYTPRMLRPVRCGASRAQENVTPFSSSGNPGNSNAIGIVSDIGNNSDMIASGIASDVGNESDIRNESDIVHGKWCITNGESDVGNESDVAHGKWSIANGESDIGNESDVAQGKWGIANGKSDIANGVPRV